MANYFEQYPTILQTIHEWNTLPEHEIIFDSRLNNWAKYYSEFYTTVKDKKNIFIMIHDMDANVFGGLISQQITQQNQWISDENSYVFIIESNNRFEHPIKYPIKSDKSQHAFIIFGNDFEYLFQFGSGYDIIACKQDHSKNFNSGVNESSFEFNKTKNPLSSSKTFVIARIVVIEMKEKVEQSNQIEQVNQINQVETIDKIEESKPIETVDKEEKEEKTNTEVPVQSSDNTVNTNDNKHEKAIESEQSENTEDQ